MLAIEVTPEAVSKLYQTMARNLAVIRRRWSSPLTLADKVLLGHLDDAETQELEIGPQPACAAAGSRGVPGRAGPERHAAVHADRPRHASRCRPRSIAII